MLLLKGRHLLACLLLLAAVAPAAQNSFNDEKYLLWDKLDQNNLEPIMDAKNPRYIARDAPHQAAAWSIEDDDDLVFYVTPAEICQAVTISGLSGKDAEDYLTFMPLEQTVRHSVKGKKDRRNTDYGYPISQVNLKFTKQGIYELKALKDEKPTIISFNLGKSKKLLVLTSSPYCQVSVVSSKRDFIPYVPIVPKKQEAVDAYNKLNNEQKTNPKTNYQLLPGSKIDDVATATFKESVCPPVYEFEGFVREQDWNAVDNITHSTYTIRNTGDKCVGSFKLEIEKPESCHWVRLCFEEAAHGTSRCSDNKKSIEISLAARFYVGTDSDIARPFGAHIKQMHSIRFEYFKEEKKDNDVKRPGELVMSYGHGSSITDGVYRRMRLHYAIASEFKVTLVKANKCRARIVTDRLNRNALTKKENSLQQCFTVIGCKQQYSETVFLDQTRLRENKKQ